MTEFDYIGQNKAEDACENGIKIGEVPISRESKGSWSELYYFNGQIISVLFFDPSNCEIFEGILVTDENELSKHTNDIDETLLKLKELRKE